METKGLRGQLRQIAAIGLAVFLVTAGFAFSPLDYSYFSWHAFGQPYNYGATCEENTDCISGFCSDNVCCDQACDGATQICNSPAALGTCTEVSMAPALSHWGYATVVIALMIGGWLGIAGRLREDG